MRKNQLDISEHKIWKDKNISPEGKTIFAYVYAIGFNKLLSHLNVGDIQPIISITNKALKRNLNILQEFKYLMFKEYDTGMYEIHIC